MSSSRKVTVNRPCVVCGGEDARPLHRLRYPEFGYPGSFELHACVGCGLVFHSPRLEPTALAGLYEGRNMGRQLIRVRPDPFL